VTDGQTDRRTDGRPDDGKDARSILLSHVKTALNQKKKLQGIEMTITRPKNGKKN